MKIASLVKDLAEWKTANRDNVLKADKYYEQNKELERQVEQLLTSKTEQITVLTKDNRERAIESIETDLEDGEMQFNSLHEYVSIPLREKIPLFSGYLASDTDIHEWFSDAERIAKGANWTDDQKKRYFSERFIKLAQAFQEKLDSNADYNNLEYVDWKKIVISEFEDPNRKEKFKIELQNIKQNEKERVRDFISKIQRLFCKAYGIEKLTTNDPTWKPIRDDILKKALQNGLNDELAPMYWHRITSDATYEQACKIAIDVENVQQAKAIFTKSNKTIQLISDSQTQLEEQCKALEKQVNNLSINGNSKLQNRNDSYKQRMSRSPERRGQSGIRPQRYPYRSNRRDTPKRQGVRGTFNERDRSKSRSPSPYRNAFSTQSSKSPSYESNASNQSSRSSSPFIKRTPFYNANRKVKRVSFDKNITCYECNKTGHVAKQCWSKAANNRWKNNH